MTKIPLKKSTMIYPLPAVMVSCGFTTEEYNIITVAWTGTVCSNPPMCYISVRKERHSHEIIKRTGEFVINLTNKNLAFATDWCGVRSGKKFDKFKEMKLTPEKGQIVKCPLIKESPLNIECVVKQVQELGSHDMFIADVVAVNAEETHFDKETGEFQLANAEMITYMHGKYYSLGKKIGKFGFSVEGTGKKSRNK
ncbi:MAG: flavin reductase family protein [Bacteroidales bacterium]|jgi:flavin reductase (DIM6/NTAB) family NADH-FMN oxidoreductase RutF|nr:flavin reductase family protein [Bacteroidales bacterium]